MKPIIQGRRCTVGKSNECFFENLNVLSKRNTCSYPKNENYSKKFYIAGIDSGSTSTEAVILDSEHNIVSSAVVPTGVSVPDSAKGV